MTRDGRRRGSGPSNTSTSRRATQGRAASAHPATKDPASAAAGRAAAAARGPDAGDGAGELPGCLWRRRPADPSPWGRKTISLWRHAGRSPPNPRAFAFTAAVRRRAAAARAAARQPDAGAGAVRGEQQLEESYPEHPATNGPARRPPGEQPPQRGADAAIDGAGEATALPLAEVMAEVAPIAKVVQRARRCWRAEEVDPRTTTPHRGSGPSSIDPAGNSSQHGVSGAPARAGGAAAGRAAAGARTRRRCRRRRRARPAVSGGGEARRRPSPWGHETICSTEIAGRSPRITRRLRRRAGAPPPVAVRGRRAARRSRSDSRRDADALEFLEFLPAGVAPPAADGVITGVADGQGGSASRRPPRRPGRPRAPPPRQPRARRRPPPPASAGHVSFALRADGTLALAAIDSSPTSPAPPSRRRASRCPAAASSERRRSERGGAGTVLGSHKRNDSLATRTVLA